MGMVTTARIINYDGCHMLLIPQEAISREMIKKQVSTVELRLCDGRESTADQRKKIHAIIGEISNWSGHDREDLRRYFTENYCEENDIDYFSLSPRKPNLADMETATGFITYLINFCFIWNVPAQDTMLNRTEEVGKYLYMCLEHKKCAICNKEAEVHHVDAIGMGRDRETIIHIGMNAIALCRNHHTQAHKMGRRSFFEMYHIFGIKLDEYLCRILKLGRTAVYNELFERDKQFLQLDELDLREEE